MQTETGSATPTGTGVNVVDEFTTPGVIQVVVSLDNMEAGDTTMIALQVDHGSGIGLLQAQTFTDDQGDAVCELVYAYPEDASAPDLVIQQTTGTNRLYRWRATTIPDAG
jgi:hypothetical protein